MKRTRWPSSDSEYEDDPTLEEWEARPDGGFQRVYNPEVDLPALKRVAVGVDKLDIKPMAPSGSLRPLSDDEYDEDDDESDDEDGESGGEGGGAGGGGGSGGGGGGGGGAEAAAGPLADLASDYAEDALPPARDGAGPWDGKPREPAPEPPPPAAAE